MRLNSLRALVLAVGGLSLGAGGVSAQGWQGPQSLMELLPTQFQGSQYRDDRPRDERYRDDRARDERYRDDRGREERGREDRRYNERGGGRGGSYQQSCSNAQQSGSVLTAICNDGRGRKVQTSIDVEACGRSDIGNIQGTLQCGSVRGSSRRVN